MPKPRFILAPGVIFDEALHEYFYAGSILSGVTGCIAKGTKQAIDTHYMSEVCADGVHVHKAIQHWIDGEPFDSVHPGAIWVKSHLEAKYNAAIGKMYSEVLVSDFKMYASAVDIVVNLTNDKLILFDIKRTFQRNRVTWQLSIYKYFIECYTKYSVDAMYCLAFTDRVSYPIFAYLTSDVEKLLYVEPAPRRVGFRENPAWEVHS